MKKRSSYVSIGLAGALLGLSFGAAPVVFADGGSTPVDTTQKVVFSRNARGQSFGSELDAASPKDAPDLIAAWATNGKLGYVYKDALHPELSVGAISPAEALKAQSDLLARGTRFIPVYEQDGVTRIGVFEIVPPSGPEIVNR